METAYDIDDNRLLHHLTSTKVLDLCGNHTDFYEWNNENDPSPKGWRIPTYAEIMSLLDENKVESVQTTQNGISGRLFTDIKTKKSIFLPNITERYSNYYEKIIDSDYEGYYWSSSIKQQKIVHTLYIRSNFFWRVSIAGESSIKNSDINDALSIRPVSVNQK